MMINRFELLKFYRRFANVGQQIINSACPKCKEKLHNNPGMKADDYCKECQTKNKKIIQEAQQELK